MYRKILLALFACLAIAVPVGVATASDQAADDSPVASTDEGTPPAPDAPSPAGNYTFTVSPKSTVKIPQCRAASLWGKLKNGKLSTFAGTIDASGNILIPGSGLKGQFPKVPLRTDKGCDYVTDGWFQPTPTGVHDNKYTPPNDWKGKLEETTETVQLNAPVDSNVHVSSKWGTADCWIGETTKKEGGYSSFIDLLLNKGTYTTSGNKVSIKMTNDIPFTLPSPFKAVPPYENPFLCMVMENSFMAFPVPVVFKLTINGTKTS